jgi:hypothetical protein
LWRALSLRTLATAVPPGAPGNFDLAAVSGPLALVLARYDRELAKSLIEEAVKAQRGIGNIRANYVTAAALADPRSVVALVEKLPDATGPGRDHLRQAVAELLLAEGDEVGRIVHHALSQWFVGDDDL